MCQKLRKELVNYWRLCMNHNIENKGDGLMSYDLPCPLCVKDDIWLLKDFIYSRFVDESEESEKSADASV